MYNGPFVKGQSGVCLKNHAISSDKSPTCSESLVVGQSSYPNQATASLVVLGSLVSVGGCMYKKT